MPPRGDPVPDMKRQIGAELARAVADRGTWNAASMMRVDPPRVSDLRQGRLERFSLETLVRFLDRLGYRVELHWEKRRFNDDRRRGGGA